MKAVVDRDRNARPDTPGADRAGGDHLTIHDDGCSQGRQPVLREVRLEHRIERFLRARGVRRRDEREAGEQPYRRTGERVAHGMVSLRKQYGPPRVGDALMARLLASADFRATG